MSLLPDETNEPHCWVMGWINENNNTIDLLVTIHQAGADNAVRVVAALADHMKADGSVIGLARITSPCVHGPEIGPVHQLAKEPRPGATPITFPKRAASDRLH